MRVPPIPRTELTPAQRPFYDDMVAGIAAHLTGFVSQRGDGALIGPFNPMLAFPAFGQATWDYIKALIAGSTLPKPVREIAILVVGARYGSRYEMYAHEHVAEHVGLAEDKIATIVSGNRPADLTAPEAAAYDLAAALSRGGALPEATYQAGVRAFGKDGTAELVYLIGGYCLVSVILNAYDVSVPGEEEGIG